MARDGIPGTPCLIIDSVLKNGQDSPLARIARVVVPGACTVGRSLARRDHKRKVKIPKIKYGLPSIHLLMGYKEIEIYSPMEVIEND